MKLSRIELYTTVITDSLFGHIDSNSNNTFVYLFSERRKWRDWSLGRWLTDFDVNFLVDAGWLLLILSHYLFLIEAIVASLCIVLKLSPALFSNCFYVVTGSQHTLCFDLCTIQFVHILFFIRSTSKSRPNNIGGGENVRPYVRPSVHKKFLRFEWNLVHR